MGGRERGTCSTGRVLPTHAESHIPVREALADLQGMPGAVLLADVGQQGKVPGPGRRLA